MIPKQCAWTIDQAQALIAIAQPFAHHAGYHLGLAGSVLTRRYSNNDLDVIVMPLDNDGRNLAGLWRAFKLLGCQDLSDISAGYPQECGRTIYRMWYGGPSNHGVGAHVHVLRQIDFFVYERLPIRERIKR